MFPVIIEYAGGTVRCETLDRVEQVLLQPTGEWEEYILSGDSDRVYPYLSLLVRAQYAYLWYAPDDDSAGFQAYGQDTDLDPEGVTIFRTNSERLEMPNDYVNYKQDAVRAVLDLLAGDSWPTTYDQMPDCLEWEEL